MLLIAIVGILQDQINPSQEPTQELVEELQKTNELLQKNNELIQQQINATAETADYLFHILEAIQANTDTTHEEDQLSPEYSVDVGSDSRLSDSNSSEPQPEPHITPDGLCSPDEN